MKTLKHHYHVYLKMREKQEPQAWRMLTIIKILTSFLAINYWNFEVKTFVVFFIACLCQTLVFNVVHACYHIDMTKGIRNMEIVNELAFFHHYVDSSMYAKIPGVYEINAIAPYGMVLLIINRACFGGNCKQYATILMLVAILDFQTHTWYHTYSRQYTSLNPFSSKFIGINYLYLLLQKIGFVNKDKHKQHHLHNIDTMNEVSGWSDFAFPGTEELISSISEKIFHMGIKSSSKRSNRIQRTSDALCRKTEFQSTPYTYISSLITSCIFYGYLSITSALFGPDVENVTCKLIVNMMMCICIVSTLVYVYFEILLQ